MAYGMGCPPAGLGFPWSYLGHYRAAVHGHPGYMAGYMGDDSTDATSGVDFSGATDISSSVLTPSDLSTLEAPGGILATGGILGPSAPPVTVDQLNTYVTTGQADPSVIGQLSQLVSAAGPAVNSILQQVQIGQLASSTPLSSLAALRAAITGQATSGTILAGLTSDPVFLIGGAVLLFMLLRKK